MLRDVINESEDVEAHSETTTSSLSPFLPVTICQGNGGREDVGECGYEDERRVQGARPYSHRRLRVQGECKSFFSKGVDAYWLG